MSDSPQDYSSEQDDEQLRSAFAEAVDDGTRRLRRSWSTLFATGLVGGIDLSIGVIALIVVTHATGSEILGALAFTIGFIALTLAKSELFTENFLVPVAAVVARQARVRALLRLWLGTFVMNLVGGWIIMALFMASMPELRATARETGRFYVELGIGWRSFALATLGGAVITVMTWMERNSEGQGTKVIGAVAASFVLAAVPLNHVIVSSVEMFAALVAGAPFGYGDYATATMWSALGNLVGGLLLVTVIRFIQVGRMPIQDERRKASATPEEGPEHAKPQQRGREERFSGASGARSEE